LLTIALFSGTGASCFVLAMSTGDVAREMLLFYLAPAWSVLGGRVFLGERLGWIRLLAVTIAVTGACCVISGRGQISAGSITREDVFALVAGLTFAAGNLCTRAADGLPVASKTSAQILGCGVVSGLIVMGAAVPMPPLGPLAVAGVVAFALVWIGVGTTTTAFGVSHIEAGRSALIILAELVTAVVSASLFQRRVPAPLELVGALLILGAAALDGLSSAPPRRAESS
jgi:drug/metabolite transporter (DMT)-like permease